MTVKSPTLTLGISAGLLMALVAWLGILNPLGDIAGLRSARTDAQVSAELQRQQVQNLYSAQSNYDDLLAKETTLTALLWPRANQLILLTTLEHTASAAGVQSELSLSDIPAGTGLVEVPITLTVRGSWPAVIAELHALEQLQPLLLVDGVTIQAVSANAVAATLTAKSLWR